MKIYRFLEDGRPRVGVGDHEWLTPHSGDVLDLGSRAGTSSSLRDAKLLPPIRPGKIVAVGRNYAEHAKELGNEPPSEPILFLKPPSAVLAPGGMIVRPAVAQRVDFEGPGHRLRQFRTPIPIYAESPAKAPTLATIDYCRIVVEIDEG